MPCTLAVFPREPADTTASAQSRPVSRPRKPEASPLWQLVTNHAHTFLDLYDDRYAPRYGPLRAVVPRALESFQRCGLLAHGFARVRCPDCRHEYLLAFSCKQRCLCPSCHAKRQAAFGEFVEGAPDPETVARLFRHKVLRMLLEEGAIEEGVVRHLLARPHTGFGAHVSRQIPADATSPGVVRELGVAYCCVDEPRLPNLPPPVARATAPVAYVRFHGRGQAVTNAQMLVKLLSTG